MPLQESVSNTCEHAPLAAHLRFDTTHPTTLTHPDALLAQPSLGANMHVVFVPSTDPSCDDVIEEAGLAERVAVHALPIFHVRVDTDLWSMFMPAFAVQFHINVPSHPYYIISH